MEIGEPSLAVDSRIDLHDREDQSRLPKFHMHLDADRDGVVDDDWQGLAKWQWGAGKRGAVVLCNDDDDDASGLADNTDRKVNKGKDKDELAPIVFRREGVSPPGSWMAYLEVSPFENQSVRIFNKRAPGGEEVIGPKAGRQHLLPSLDFTELEYGMEAVRFAGQGFDGMIHIVFRIVDEEKTVSVQKASVRVAPWMMPNHLDPATKVFVVDSGRFNERFRKELRALVTAAGCELEEFTSRDPWMQDCMEIGFSAVPGHTQPVVLRTNRNRPLRVFPRRLLGPTFGYEELRPIDKYTTYDSGGNLEVTPPVTSKAGKKYPWGRIYFGPGLPDDAWGFSYDCIDRRTRMFLHWQTVQAPIEVDTTWLAVGHVDEIITFVPAPGPKGFKMLLASPHLAYEIVHRAAKQDPAARLLTGRDLEGVSAEVSVAEFMKEGISKLWLLATNLRAYNEAIAERLDATRTQFETEIGVTATDIIEVPALYMPNRDQPETADALTGGMINMLVLNRHCVAAKPFGPVVSGKDLFEEDLVAKLKPLGLQVSFLDDWWEYHLLLGEVHCATNTLRKPKPPNWWEYVP